MEVTPSCTQARAVGTHDGSISERGGQRQQKKKENAARAYWNYVT